MLRVLRRNFEFLQTIITYSDIMNSFAGGRRRSSSCQWPSTSKTPRHTVPAQTSLGRRHILDVIEECRLFFDFLLPSKMLEITRAKFNCKLVNCSNVLNFFGLGLSIIV